jgi:hypothetical protein
VQLEALTAACQAATFGLGGEDVLDETYRKAGKLDNEQFATKLQNEVYSILSSALPTLYDDGDDDNGKMSCVVAELYKLNVYGTTCGAPAGRGSRLTFATRGRSVLQVAQGHP